MSYRYQEPELMLPRCRYAILIIVVLLSSTRLMAEGSASDVPELKVLDQFVGKWEGKSPNGQIIISENQWALNGHFIKQEYTTGEKVKGMIMRGYESSLNKYVMTIFDSNGTALMMLGDWNKETETLTCSGDIRNGASMTMESSFPDPDTEAFVITIKVNGQVITEIKAENHRVKAK